MAQSCKDYLGHSELIKPLICYTLALKRGNLFGLITCGHTGKKMSVKVKKSKITQHRVRSNGVHNVQW